MNLFLESSIHITRGSPPTQTISQFSIFPHSPPHLSIAFIFVSLCRANDKNLCENSLCRHRMISFSLRIRVSLKTLLAEKFPKWIYKSHLCKSICTNIFPFSLRVYAAAHRFIFGVMRVWVWGICSWMLVLFFSLFKTQKRDVCAQVECVKCKWMAPQLPIVKSWCLCVCVYVYISVTVLIW